MSGLPETIGRYQIVGSLGRGGMATVYKAFHPALDRTVAIKVIRRDLTDEPDFLDRFRQEAKAVARLRHPNVVQIFDFDEVDGKQFIVMEYLEGGTLKERLHALTAAGHRLPPRETARIVSEVADGLSYAHGFGILHRDVKPANVLLTRDGRAVVTDFGIAKLLASGAQLTRTGMGVGTPEYMAPEQARGQEIDARADVYSLAVIAYEMVTGRVPYTGDSAISVIFQQINDPPPPPTEIEPRVGQATEAVLVRALAKDRDDRYPGATEFARALGEAIAADERDRTSGIAAIPVPVTMAPPKPVVAAPVAAGPTPWPLIGGAIVFVIVGGIVASTVMRGAPDGSPEPSGPAQFQAAPRKDTLGVPFSALPRGQVTYERAGNFSAQDVAIGERSPAGSVTVTPGAIELRGAGPPAASVSFRGTTRLDYIADYVIETPVNTAIHLQICVRRAATEEQMCFAILQQRAELRYVKPGESTLIAEREIPAPAKPERTFTVFIQQQIMTLYIDGDPVIDTPTQQRVSSDLAPAIVAFTGRFVVKSVRMHALGPGQVLSGPGGSPGSARFELGIVSGGGIHVAVDGRVSGGPVPEIAAGSQFGFSLNALQPVQLEYVRTVGPVPVEHPPRGIPSATGIVASCCYIAPLQPGFYRLIVGGNGGKMLAEMPYTVR